jgi:hypothetical protein
MAGSAIAAQMEHANENAETQTKDQAQATPCLDCGQIDCFNPPEGADPEEFRRQLKEQQDTINNAKPDDLLNRIQKYKDNRRPSDDARDRKTVRDSYRSDRTKELEEKFLDEGHSDYEQMAKKQVAEEMAKLAATHTLDLVAGGDGSISGMGDASVNSSMGAQWKGRRVEQLKKHAENAQRRGKKMNVSLEECPPRDKTNEVPVS